MVFVNALLIMSGLAERVLPIQILRDESSLISIEGLLKLISKEALRLFIESKVPA